MSDTHTISTAADNEPNNEDSAASSKNHSSINNSEQVKSILSRRYNTKEYREAILSKTVLVVDERSKTQVLEDKQQRILRLPNGVVFDFFDYCTKPETKKCYKKIIHPDYYNTKGSGKVKSEFVEKRLSHLNLTNINELIKKDAENELNLDRDKSIRFAKILLTHLVVSLAKSYEITIGGTQNYPTNTKEICDTYVAIKNIREDCQKYWHIYYGFLDSYHLWQYKVEAAILHEFSWKYDDDVMKFRGAIRGIAFRIASDAINFLRIQINDHGKRHLGIVLTIQRASSMINDENRYEKRRPGVFLPWCARELTEEEKKELEEKYNSKKKKKTKKKKSLEKSTIEDTTEHNSTLSEESKITKNVVLVNVASKNVETQDNECEVSTSDEGTITEDSVVSETNNSKKRKSRNISEELERKEKRIRKLWSKVQELREREKIRVERDHENKNKLEESQRQKRLDEAKRKTISVTKGNVSKLNEQINNNDNDNDCGKKQSKNKNVSKSKKPNECPENNSDEDERNLMINEHNIWDVEADPTKDCDEIKQPKTNIKEIDEDREYGDSIISIVNIRKKKDEPTELLCNFKYGDRWWAEYSNVFDDNKNLVYHYLESNNIDKIKFDIKLPEKKVRKHQPKKRRKDAETIIDMENCTIDHKNWRNYGEEYDPAYCKSPFHFFEVMCANCSIEFTNEKVLNGTYVNLI
jgi:hypothetical protein